MKLYEINEKIRDVIEGGFAVDYDTGEVYENVEGLEALTVALNDKLEACACVYKEMQAEADAVKAEKNRLAKREKALRNRADRLRLYIQGGMEASGTKKLESPRARITSRRSSSVVVDDEAMLPKAFVRTKHEPDKAAIRDAIKHGTPVLGAHMEERTSYTIL